MPGPAGFDEFGIGLLREISRHQITELLVVLDESAHGASDVARRGTQPLGSQPLKQVCISFAQKSRSVAEDVDDRLYGDPSARGDII